VKQKRTKDRLSSVTLKLNILFLIVVIFVGIFAVFVNNKNTQIMNSHIDNTESYYNVLNIRSGMERCLAKFDDFIDTGMLSYLIEYNNNMQAMRETLYRLKYKRDDAKEVSLVSALEKSLNSYNNEANTALGKSKNKDQEYFERYHRAREISSFINKYCDELLNIMIANEIQKKDELISQRNFVLGMSLVMMLLMAAATTFFALYFNIYITRPMNKMEKMARGIAAGNFGMADIKVESEDEMGRLASTFNYMKKKVGQTVNLLNEKAEIEQKLRNEQVRNFEQLTLIKETKLQALQAQINPHFLFNTLNSISRSITLGKKAEGEMLVSAMSNILRYNLYGNSKVVSLKKELDILYEYVAIQRFRFGNRIEFSEKEYGTPKGIVKIPPLILQPLVENAITHGMENKATGGMIGVRVRYGLKQVVITIVDNGSGISPDMLADIMSGRKADNDDSGIGLNNVRERLHIFAGENCFKLNSKVGYGTVAKIVLTYEGEK